MKDTSKKVCASFPQEKSEDGEAGKGKKAETSKKFAMYTHFGSDYNFERKK